MTENKKLEKLIYELDYYIKYELPQEKRRMQTLLRLAKEAQMGAS